MGDVTVEARVTGRVQGVGFRFWVREQAEALGLEGWVRNEPDRSVAVLVSGRKDRVAELVEALKDGPQAAIVADVTTRASEEEAGPGFHITG